MEMSVHEKSNETTPDQSPCSRNSLDRFNLSRSAGCHKLHTALNRVKVNLSSSCFATLSAEKGPAEGDDLTNLSWLQDNNLLKSLTSTPKSKTSASSDDKANHRITLKDYEMLIEEENGLSVKKLTKDSGYGKPPYSFSMLIFMAIESAPNKRLPVKDIYAWIMDNFRYFRNAPLGWKNSVRHNLSLNKCFKKVDRDKSQGVGKGSLWCIDPESRPSLLQGMRKNQVLMAKIDPNAPSSFLTTPPPSPGNNDGYGSFGQDSFYGRGTSPDFDDKEFDAAAAMCTMSTPRELRAIEHERLRSQTSTPTENIHSNPALLNRWRKYIEPLSDSDSSTGSQEETPVRRHKIRSAGESGSTYTIANLLTDVSLHSSQKLKRSANGLSVDQTFETETDIDDHYDFGNDSDYDYDDDVSDEEIDNNMKKLVERDTLGDSGYVEGRQAVMSDHSYSRTPKRAKQARSDGKLGVSMEVQALLSLANEATRQLEVIHGQKSE
eukprot:gene13506-4386_t